MSGPACALYGVSDVLLGEVYGAPDSWGEIIEAIMYNLTNANVMLALRSSYMYYCSENR